VGEKLEMFEREHPKECIFCGDLRNKGRNQWRSSVIIATESVFKDQIITVCPDCRKKHSIQELYEKVIASLISEAEEIVAMKDPEEKVEKPYRSPLW